MGYLVELRGPETCLQDPRKIDLEADDIEQKPPLRVARAALQRIIYSRWETSR